jgi:hypothetical protein
MQRAQKFSVLIAGVVPAVHSPSFVNGRRQNQQTDKTKRHSVQSNLDNLLQHI